MTHFAANTICQQTASGRDGALSAKADKGSLSPPLFSENDPHGPLFLRVTMQDCSLITESPSLFPVTNL